MAEFMSSINLSEGLNWTYPLKTFPLWCAKIPFLLSSDVGADT
jgi:hypothetical protein